MMMDLLAVDLVSENEEEEDAKGMNVCVVKGCRSSTLTSKMFRRLLNDDNGRRVRGKQEKRLMVGLAGAPLGEVL